MVEAPETLSELVGLAVVDFEAMIKDPNHHYNPDIWHDHIRNDSTPKKCYACIAGSLIRGTLGCGYCECMLPGSFSRDWSFALVALDSIRKGNLNTAYYSIKGVSSLGIQDAKIQSAPCRDGQDYDTWTQSVLAWLKETRDILTVHGL